MRVVEAEPPKDTEREADANEDDHPEGTLAATLKIDPVHGLTSLLTSDSVKTTGTPAATVGDCEGVTLSVGATWMHPVGGGGLLTV